MKFEGQEHRHVPETTLLFDFKIFYAHPLAVRKRELA
jgi:hypothetical protein